MIRRSVAAIFSALLCGCAVLFPPLEPPGAALETDGRAALPAGTPVTVVDVEDVPPKQRCENLTRGGSRIVVAKRCRPPNDDGVDELAVAEQLDQVRRDQEELDRRRREVEARRGPGLN